MTQCHENRGLSSFILRPYGCLLRQSNALILDHTAEVPCKCGPGYAEQFCRTPLVLIRLLEHEMYMPFHGTCERKIDVGVVRFIIAGKCGNWFACFGRGIGF